MPKPETTPIFDRGQMRWIINIIRSSPNTEIAILDLLADVEAWLRKAQYQYKDSYALKVKARAVRESVRAAYIITQELFREAQSQNVFISASMDQLSNVERVIRNRQ